MIEPLVQRAAQIRSAQELAQLLRALRRRHARRRRDSEVTYRELAAQAGWSHTAIAEYMSGHTLPPTDRLDVLMRMLGASAAELAAVATARDRIEELRRNERRADSSPGEKAGVDLWSVPRQLPAAPPHFVGRAVESQALFGLAGQPTQAGTVMISAVAGMAGIGKTALALHAGHRLAGWYPDGQLFVDLHGYTDGVAQVEPADALYRLLRNVGVPGEQIPGGLDERAALWRSVLAGRRMLILLDNAATEAQVQPLLPGAAGCLVLVTSRRRLTALQATQVVSLDALPEGDAAQLLVRTAGRSDLAADAPEVLEAVHLCGRLPLAIHIAAARLKHRRVWTVADVVQRLRDLEVRPDALADGQRSVHATLHLSYRYLSTDAQRMYRLLGLHPGPDVEPCAAMALTRGSLDEVRLWLDRLVDDHLLEEPAHGRYRFHDLVRGHARDTAGREETETQRRAALGGLLDYYLYAASAAMAIAYPYERARRRPMPARQTPLPDLRDAPQALDWLDTELPNLLSAAQYAAKHGWPAHTWQLSALLHEHLRTRGRYRDAETLQRQALDLACAVGDRKGQLQAEIGLGDVDWFLGRYEQANAHFGRALHIAEQIGDHSGQLNARIGFGDVHRFVGRHEQAGHHYRQALQIAHTIGDRCGERHALAGLGYVHWSLGRYEQASDHFEQALLIAQDIGDRRGQRHALAGLGQVHRLLGRYQQASERFEQALRIAQDIGDRIGELQALTCLGNVHRMLGRHAEAVGCFQQVLDLARGLGNTNWQFEALQNLGRVHSATGHPELALTHHHQALRYATELAQPEDQARAHDGLARAHHALDHQDLARSHWHQSLNILTGLGVDFTEDVETNVSGLRANLADLADLERRQPSTVQDRFAPPRSLENDDGVVPLPGSGLREIQRG